MHNGSGSWTKVPLVLLFLYKYFQIQNVIWCEPQEDQQEDSTASFKRSRHGSLSNSPDSSPTSLTSVIPKYTIDEENWLQGKKKTIQANQMIKLFLALDGLLISDRDGFYRM